MTTTTETKIRQGRFEVINSFAIKSRNEFYLLGRLIEGVMEKDWFLYLPFNRSIGMTIPIDAIEEVEIAGEERKYQLIIVKSDDAEWLSIREFLLGFRIEYEILDVFIEGER